MIPNKSEAEDILQETNLILCQKAGEYDPNKHLGWAFKIARFQMMKHLTNSKRNKIQFSTDLFEEVASEELTLGKYKLLESLSICYGLPKSMQSIAKMRFKEEPSLKIISKS